MKRIITLLQAALLVLLAAAVSCNSQINSVDIENIPAVNGSKIVPKTDESGTTKAYIGTEVTLDGYNLDRVSRVEIADVTAEITEQTMRVLKFQIPALDLGQRDNPWPVSFNVFDEQSEIIFRTTYYVTVPVTDAIVSGYEPTEGTLGTEITVAGRNLQQVTRIHFGAATIEAADFSAAAEDGASVKFRVPAGSYDAGDSSVAISAEWRGGSLDVTGETPFTMHTPAFDPAKQTGVSIIGDEFALTGKNLNLVTKLFWGEFELLIVDQAADKLTVRIPSSVALEGGDKEASAALTARWGEPEQTITVAEGWKVDRTPLGPAAPVVSAMTAEDGGEANKFYLGKVVTVKGENLSTVEGFVVGGIAAELVDAPTDLEAKFTMPAGFDFTEATEVEIKAVYNNGEQVDAGKATVYPFYYYTDVVMGSGSSSTSAFPYPEFAWTNAFFLPDTGEVISTDAWWEREIDKFAKANNAPQKSAYTLDKDKVSEADYYGVLPYLFITTGSDGKLAWQNPANSASQLKTHRYDEGKTALSSTYGTPIIFFRALKPTDATAATVIDGSIKSLAAYTTIAGSNAPAFGDARDWTVGDVLVVQYVTYTKGTKPAAPEDICRQGFMYVKEVTCGDAAKGTATDLTGHVKFDLYWSQTLNK